MVCATISSERRPVSIRNSKVVRRPFAARASLNIIGIQISGFLQEVEQIVVVRVHRLFSFRFGVCLMPTPGASFECKK